MLYFGNIAVPPLDVNDNVITMFTANLSGIKIEVEDGEAAQNVLQFRKDLFNALLGVVNAPANSRTISY
uniref:Uncharacterized protein n=1 Tax=Panagrolaimus sp. PS1159 TaxID=55785 RepID=A0AC35GLH7_9BILA